MHRALDGWMLARAPASRAQGLHHHGPRYFNFSYLCTMCGLEKLGIVDQNWLTRTYSSDLLLRTLVAGRRQQSESIEAALDMELLLLLLFLTFSALVVHPKKTTLHGGQSRSWSAEQGKKEKEKVWQRPPTLARCSFPLVRRKK